MYELTIARHPYVMPIRHTFRRMGLKRVTMLRFEKSLDQAQNGIDNGEISYVMLNETNLPDLISQGLLPDSPLESLARNVWTDWYVSKRNERINDCMVRLQKGDKCIVGVLRDKAVGWIWIYRQNEKYEPAIETKIEIDPYCSFIYRWLVYPQYRNRGFGTMLLDRALHLLNEQNRKKAIVMVEKDNQPSLRATKKLGFEATESIKRVRVFGYSKLSVNQLNLSQD